MKYILAFLCSCNLFIVFSLAQEANVDSVLMEVPDSLDEDEEFDFLISTANQIKATDIVLAKGVLENVLTRANKEGFEMQYARALGSSARIHGLEGRDDLLLTNYLAAIEVYEGLLTTIDSAELEEKIIGNISVCYNNLAQVYVNDKKYDLALDFYKSSLSESIKINDSLGISIRCYNIGFVYMNLNEYDSAFHYMYWSKDLEKGMNSPEGLAYAHEGLASIYDNQEEYLKALIQIDSAIYYIDMFGDDLFKMDILYKKAVILHNIGGLAESANVFTLAYEMAKTVGYKSFELDALNNLKNTYFDLEDYRKSAVYAKLQIELMKEISADETEKKVEEYMVQYESEQKDKEIAQLALQNELKEEANQNLLEKRKAEESRSRIIYWSLGAGILMLSSIGFLLFMDSRRRKRINRLLKVNNENLARKNEQILHQSKLIGDSINYAQNIQRAILPTSTEMSDQFEDHFVLFLPKDVVSGDFYWLHAIPNTRKVLYSVADCTGHGVPGAFMSIVGHALLEKIAKQLNVYPPAKVLNQLAFELQNTLKKGEGAVDDGMDMALVMVDYETNTVHFAGARNPLVFISDQELTFYKGDRVDLGKQSDVDFKQATIKFKTGDMLYMFTDGFPDQKGGQDGKKYYPVRFRDFIKDISSESMSDQKQRLWSEFENWKGKQEQMDDVLVVGIQL